MDNTVSTQPGDWRAEGLVLRGRAGRKYLTRAERWRVAQEAEALEERKRLFVLMLLWTGARISEVLAITEHDFDLTEGVVSLRTLKRRKAHMREVPLPPSYLAALDRFFDLVSTRRDPDAQTRRLFAWSRVTGWRIIKLVCGRARIDGLAAAPKGMRHSFGIATLASGVPLPVTQKWLGHARPASTMIYQQAVGDEEREFAGKFWDWTEREAA